ncbi:MAG: glycoside hydrolase family 2 protein [Alicyclobacillus sp.]|nr:glycoside hydrolase family 2 protein [Alicyclobacillus sp.]
MQLELTKGWKLHRGVCPHLDNPAWTDDTGLPLDVPGDVHTTLTVHGHLAHPFFGRNAEACRWVEDEVWWFRTTFDASPLWSGQAGLPAPLTECIELVCEGLDTMATVYLNGLELGRSDNMFVPFVADVTPYVQHGANVLAIRFDPPATHTRSKDLRLWSAFSRERPWLRKCQRDFGWDWCPRLPAIGIWRPVRLQRRPRQRWRDVYAWTAALTEQLAEVRVQVAAAGMAATQTVRASVQLRADGRVIATATVQPLPAHGTTLTLHVPQPRRWWTHDLGEPYLYTLEAQLWVDGQCADTYRCSLGLRTLRLRTESEQGKPAFAFELNGVPLFAKGANWIPVDSFHAAVPDSRVQHLLQLAVEANMNMLRVWGGGLYERDAFYEACDRLGLLVWQDFLFACALYPDFNREFVASVQAEVAANVRRLRNHPCLALWCGNNENDWLYELQAASGQLHSPFYGARLYHEHLPRWLAELDPQRPYWPSSPYGGNDHNDMAAGDHHNWQVWHGHVYPRRFGEKERLEQTPAGVSYRHYAHCTALFVSEYGIQSAPHLSTLRTWLPADVHDWRHPEVAFRNKDPQPQKLELTLLGSTGLPDSLEAFVLLTQFAQAEGLKFGSEHFRRQGATQGALIWQLNDCWPGITWSLIDYHRLPKAAYYAVRRSFAPRLLSLAPTDNDWTLWLVNDTLQPFADTVHVEVWDAWGRPLAHHTVSAQVPAHASVCLHRFREEALLNGGPASQAVVRLSCEHGNAPANLVYLRDWLDMELPEARVIATWSADRGQVTLQTDRLARMVTLDPGQPDITCSDNAFDLLPGEQRVVQLRSACGQVPVLPALTVRWLNGGITPGVTLGPGPVSTRPANVEGSERFC